jgi:hypothetical protein
MCSHNSILLWDSYAWGALSRVTIVSYELLQRAMRCVLSTVNPALVPWGLCDPSPLWLAFFFVETVTNTDIAFHVFLRRAFLTMSHTFARFCVFPFSFYLCLFPLGHKRTPLYLPCGTDNCLQNAQNAVRVSASVYSKVPKTKSCLFVDIWVQTVLWNIIWGKRTL